MSDEPAGKGSVSEFMNLPQPTIYAGAWDDTPFILDYMTTKQRPNAQSSLESALRKLYYFVTVRRGNSNPRIRDISREDAATFIQWLGAPPEEDLNTKTNRYRLPDGGIDPAWRPLRKRLTLASAKTIVMTLSALWTFGCNVRYTEMNVWKTLSVDKIPPFNNKEAKAPTKRQLNPSAIYLLVAYTHRPEETQEPTVKGAEQRWMLLLYLLTVTRISEVAKATPGHIVFNEEEGMFELHLITKGQNDHVVAWPVALQQEYNRYRDVLGLTKIQYQGNRARPGGLEREPSHVSSPDHDYLIKHHYRIASEKPVGRTTLYRRITTLFREAAEWGKANGMGRASDIEQLEKASPHWLRHAVISALVNDLKVPLEVTRDIVGHASSRTTERYQHASRANNIDAIQRLAAMIGSGDLQKQAFKRRP